ncbi:hypothetical protein ABT297_04050 [Dactylosporangium sp. NPDC000555]|uniref:hypothetical protein n=1 Tax=Dactylosporangium sp. NPDC000555 TaxID=3154260 RepID=UPI00331D6FEE
MSQQHILKNVRLFAGAADLTGQSNKVELSGEFEEKDVTTFGSYDPATDSIWKEVRAGLGSAKLTASGHWQAGDVGLVDDDAWAALGGIGAWTVCPVSATPGGLAYIVNGLRSTYKLGGGVGDVAPWDGAASGTWPLARGLSAHGPATARTTTGAGTAITLPAVSATQQLIASLHVLSVAGTGTPTITVKVQSAPDGTFAAPTDRLMFSPATVRGGQILRALGPITDTSYRVSWTITGTGPSFLFVAAIGISGPPA